MYPHEILFLTKKIFYLSHSGKLFTGILISGQCFLNQTDVVFKQDLVVITFWIFGQFPSGHGKEIIYTHKIFLILISHGSVPLLVVSDPLCLPTVSQTDKMG